MHIVLFHAPAVWRCPCLNALSSRGDDHQVTQSWLRRRPTASALLRARYRKTLAKCLPGNGACLQWVSRELWWMLVALANPRLWVRQCCTVMFAGILTCSMTRWCSRSVCSAIFCSFSPLDIRSPDEVFRSAAGYGGGVETVGQAAEFTAALDEVLRTAVRSKFCNRCGRC